MGKKRTVLTVLFIVAALSAVFLLTVIAFVPDDFAQGLLRGWLEKKAGLSFRADRFKKVFPAGFESQGMTIFRADNGNAAFNFDKVEVRLNILRIFLGEISADMEGMVGAGKIRGAAALRRKGVDLDLSVDRVNAADVPHLRALGLKGPGSISGKAKLGILYDAPCPGGSISAAGEDFDLSSVAAMGFSSLFKDRALVNLDISIGAGNCRARLKALTVDGHDASLRLYGDIFLSKGIPDSEINMTIEIFSKNGPAEGAASLTLLKQYRKSSNFYSMRLKGRADNPALTQ